MCASIYVEQEQFDPDHEPSSRELLKYVVQKVDSKWKSLARFIGLEANRIDSIDVEGTSNQDKLQKALEIWRKQSKEDIHWHDIFTALKEIDEVQLANSLDASFEET